MTRRPNILLITSDMQRADCFGRFEKRGVRAPHVEMLAEAGTRFSSCITPSPICMPARASILTGLLPLTHGLYDNGIDLSPEMSDRGFAGTLGRAGYRTGFIGKAHFSTFETFKPTGSPECRFSSADYPEDWTGPYGGFDHVELMTVGHLHRKRAPERPPHGQHYERWFWSRAEGDRPFEMHTTSMSPETGAANTWDSALPEAWHTSTWTADRAIDFFSKQDGDTPFCAWVSFPDPHQPYSPPDPWHRMYDPDEVTIPEHRTMDLERRPWWHRAALEGEPQIKDARLANHRKTVSRVPPQTDEQLRHMTANYFGMISLVDHNVGRILNALADQGLKEDTLIIYTSDHGEFLGDHGLYLKGPMLYDSLLRVGLVMSGPGIPAGQVVDAPVSTMDLPATFYDIAGVEAPMPLQSESLLPVMKDGKGRAAAYNEWSLQAVRCGVALDLRTVRTTTHRLTLELGSNEGEMYDLVNDPDEMDNIYADPAHAEIRQHLEELIRNRPGEVLENLPEAVGIY